MGDGGSVGVGWECGWKVAGLTNTGPRRVVCVSLWTIGLG